MLREGVWQSSSSSSSFKKRDAAVVRPKREDGESSSGKHDKTKSKDGLVLELAAVVVLAIMDGY